MRRVVMILILGLVPASAGCSLHDMLFDAFGTYHSSGHSRADRHDDFDRPAGD